MSAHSLAKKNPNEFSARKYRASIGFFDFWRVRRVEPSWRRHLQLCRRQPQLHVPAVCRKNNIRHDLVHFIDSLRLAEGKTILSHTSFILAYLIFVERSKIVYNHTKSIVHRIASRIHLLLISC